MSRRYVQALLDAQRTAQSAPKRKTTTESTDVDTDVLNIVAAFEKMPAFVVARVLLNEGDPLLNTRRLVGAAGQTPEQRAALVAKIRQGYIDRSDFWEQFVKHCFPNVTQLPNDTASWRHLAVRIFDIIASITYAATDDAYAVTTAANELQIRPFGESREFKSALDSSITCKQLFDRTYSLEYEVADDREDGMQPDSDIYVLVLSEQAEIATWFGYPNRGVFQNVTPGIAMESTAEPSDDDGGEDMNDEAWNGWEVTKTVRYRLNHFTLHVNLNPVQFIRDEIFVFFKNRHTDAGWRYAPPTTSPYRRVWTAQVV